jgi:hypothetical protein
MMWIKDANGNWYCDGSLCTSSLAASSFVWDKNDEGTWFLAQAAAPVSRIPFLPRGGTMSFAG